MTASKEKISRSEHAAARSGMYRLLAALFRSEPAAALIDQFRHPEFRDALSSAAFTLPDDFFAEANQQSLTELEVEYARLFIGPGWHISPHESVHREDEESGLYGRSTVKVRQFLETAGFTFQPDYTGLPDHISVEFEFMETLTGREVEAWETGDINLAMKCLEIETLFVQQHLTCWVPDFCTKVAEETELLFYREIAKLTRDFIEMEEEHLSTAKHRIPHTNGRDRESIFSQGYSLKHITELQK